MLEHAKVGWAIRTFLLLRNQRHWTHSLCWNIQRLIKQSGHCFRKIRGTGLTHYVGTCKGWLSNQDIPSEKSEALDPLAMLEHSKVGEQSKHCFRKIRGIGLTAYVETCKGWLSNQDILSEKSKALDSLSMLEYTKVVWAIRPSCLSSEKSKALDLHSMLKHAKVVWAIRTFLLRNQRHWTHPLCWTWKGCLNNLAISSEKSEALDSHPMLECAKVVWALNNEDISSEKSEALDSLAILEHAKIDWAIRTPFPRNQRH